MLRSIAGLSATERQTEQNERRRKGVLTPVEAADHLGTTEATLRWYRCKSMGPRFHKQGGRCFYLKHELDDYRAERAS